MISLVFYHALDHTESKGYFVHVKVEIKFVEVFRKFVIGEFVLVFSQIHELLGICPLFAIVVVKGEFTMYLGDLWGLLLLRHGSNRVRVWVDSNFFYYFAVIDPCWVVLVVSELANHVRPFLFVGDASELYEFVCEDVELHLKSWFVKWLIVRQIIECQLEDP